MTVQSKHTCQFCEPEAPRPDRAWCHGTGFDIAATDVPVCPYCGAEMSTDDLYESTTRDCDECGAEVEVEVDYKPYYTTRRTLAPRAEGREQPG